MLCKAVLDDLLNRHPQLTRQANPNPMLYQFFGHHFRAQNVTFGQLRDTFQALNAQAQIVQFPAHKIKQAQVQPGRQDLVLHDLFAYQFKRPPVKRDAGRSLTGRGYRQWFFPGLRCLRHPGGIAVPKCQPAITARLQAGRATRKVPHGGQSFKQGFGEVGQHPAGVRDKELSRLRGQKTIFIITGRHKQLG